MSIIERAKTELELTGFYESERDTMIKILELFFDEWDSGGAVWAVAPVLQRLIAGKCLTPLSGEDDEWVNVGSYHGVEGVEVYQNKRVGSVFKQSDRYDFKPYDIDLPRTASGDFQTIEFPYWSDKAEVSSPIIEI